MATEKIKKEEGNITIDLDGQQYKILYSLNGQLVTKLISILEKQGYRLLKRLAKAFARKSRRISSKKNLN